jgi:hypothetical protein
LSTATDGSPVRRSNLHRRSWKPLPKRAKLPDVPVQALRHSAATLAFAAGVNRKVVQERLGHSSITLALDTYSHAAGKLAPSNPLICLRNQTLMDDSGNHLFLFHGFDSGNRHQRNALDRRRESPGTSALAADQRTPKTARMASRFARTRSGGTPTVGA